MVVTSIQPIQSVTTHAYASTSKQRRTYEVYIKAILNEEFQISNFTTEAVERHCQKTSITEANKRIVEVAEANIPTHELIDNVGRK